MKKKKKVVRKTLRSKTPCPKCKGKKWFTYKNGEPCNAVGLDAMIDVQTSDPPTYEDAIAEGYYDVCVDCATAIGYKEGVDPPVAPPTGRESKKRAKFEKLAKHFSAKGEEGREYVAQVLAQHI